MSRRQEGGAKNYPGCYGSGICSAASAAGISEGVGSSTTVSRKFSGCSRTSSGSSGGSCRSPPGLPLAPSAGDGVGKRRKGGAERRVVRAGGRHGRLRRLQGLGLPCPPPTPEQEFSAPSKACPLHAPPLKDKLLWSWKKEAGLGNADQSGGGEEILGWIRHQQQRLWLPRAEHVCVSRSGCLFPPGAEARFSALEPLRLLAVFFLELPLCPGHLARGTLLGHPTAFGNVQDGKLEALCGHCLGLGTTQC